MQADEKKCPQCAEAIKAEAKVCRFCSYRFNDKTSFEAVSSQRANKGKKKGKGWLTALSVLVVFVIVLSIVGSGSQSPTAPNITTAENVAETADKLSAAPAAEEPKTLSSGGLFGPQANAARNAQQYLEMTGFSRRGLIEQLSSDAGSGYDVADATAAVDSLKVDWNEQAIRSAKQYLSMTGFSCSGLIEQLSSDAGSKYTNAQARYGAEKAGAC